MATSYKQARQRLAASGSNNGCDTEASICQRATVLCHLCIACPFSYAMTPLSCGQCGLTVYFENTACRACGASLGFLPSERRVVAFASGPNGPGPWMACGSHQGQWLQPCVNWAETCAHYLLVVDAVQVATAWGLSLSGPAAAMPMAPDSVSNAPIGEWVLAQWLPVARLLNAMNRSLGLRDSYPFQLSDVVLSKMSTVQQLLQQVTP